MSIKTSRTTVRDYSECDILWFSSNQTYDPGSFISAGVETRSAGTWLSSGRWLYSGRGINDVVNCSWQKTVDGNIPGVCMLSLKSEKDWDKLIKPGDALMVFMTGFSATANRKSTFISIVFVDTVGEGVAVDAGTGATVKVTAVSARDITKIFAQTSTVFDPALIEIDQFFYQPAFLERLGTKFGLSPLEMVLNIIDIFYNAIPTALNEDISRFVRMQWRFPGVEQIPIVSLIDFMTFVQAPLYGYCAPTIVDIAMAGNIMTLLQGYSNDAVNELFFDVRDLTSEARESRLYQEGILKSKFVSPADAEEQSNLRQKIANNMSALGKGFTSNSNDQNIKDSAGIILTKDGETSVGSTVAMVFRQRPYDTGAFMRLQLHVLDEIEVLNSSLSTSYHNVSNFFRVSSAPTIPKLLQEATFGIMVNPKSISQFGLRRRDIETQFPFASRSTSADWDIGKVNKPEFDSTFRYYIDLVSTWDAFNERFLEGTILAHFRPDIRVGNRLQYNRTNRRGEQETILLYIQAVKHNFSETAGQSQTFLTLVRGFSESDVSSPEANIFWTTEGRSLPIDPYEVFQQAGFQKPPNAAKDGK